MGKKLVKTILIDGKEYRLNIFVERRNSVRASLTNNGINIRLPKHLSVQEQNKEGKRLLDWAVGKIKNGENLENEQKIYSHNEEIQVLNRKYRLDVENRLSARNFTKLKDGVIYFKIANHNSEEAKQEYISKQLRKIFAKEHSDYIKALIYRINETHFKKRLGNVTVKYTTSRWGQCHTRTGDIHISTRLLLAPLAVIEYVIVHELAHLYEANHSERFWNIVRRVDPYYKSKNLWLRKNGHTLRI